MAENDVKLKNLHGRMLAMGIPATLVAWGTAVLWIWTGIWWPFIIGMTVCIALCCLMTVMYYRSTEYICPACDTRFRPPFRAVFFAAHTPKTRRLVCPGCGSREWCTEVAAE